jgi:CHASE1-domain containing sensor protein
VPEFKFYLPKGQPIQDVITDIPPINSQARERLGYSLVERALKVTAVEDMAEQDELDL